MRPLRVRATLRGGVASPGAPLALDALLAYVVADRAGLPAVFDAPAPVEIPVAREPSGRFHLCSHARAPAVEARETRWVNRRFPVEEAQAVGDARLRRVRLAGGPTKSYRLPYPVTFVPWLEWFLVGDPAAVADLLADVTHVGKKRGVGVGAVAAWDVEEATPWGDGFPVACDGVPLRPLPADWPGLRADVERAWCGLTYPYWHHDARAFCAVPSGWRS